VDRCYFCFVFRNCPESLSRTQQLFERKEADYQHAENLESLPPPALVTPAVSIVSLSPDVPDSVPSADLPFSLTDQVPLALIEQLSSSIGEVSQPIPSNTFLSPQSISSKPLSSSPQPTPSQANANPILPAQTTPFSDDTSALPSQATTSDDVSSFQAISSPDYAKSEEDSVLPVEEVAEFPYPDPLDPDSTFSCMVTHIEKHNIVYIKKLPIKPVFPDGTDFIADAPLLNQYDPGTPCLARFEEDHRWYRAEVTGQHQRTVFVCFVDYGLTQAINDMDKLLVLPNEYKVLPRQAIICSLPAMPSPVEVSLPEDQYLTMLATLIGDKRFSCTVGSELDDDWGCPFISLRLEKEQTPLSELLAAAIALHDYKTL